MKPAVSKVQVVVYTRNPQLRFLLLRRGPDRGSIWQPVTGKMEPEDTDHLAAARRELREETGIEEVLSLDDLDCEFRFEKKGVEVSERLVGAELEGPCPITLSHEHVDAAWLGADRALGSLTWETNREGLQRVLAHIAAR